MRKMIQMIILILMIYSIENEMSALNSCLNFNTSSSTSNEHLIANERKKDNKSKQK